LLLNLPLPKINAHMTTAKIDVVHAAENAPVGQGGKLFDITVDLSAAAPHDCPPISHYRLVTRDRVWLRRLEVGPGAEPAVGANLALFSTEPDESLDTDVTRAVRLTIAGIIPQTTWDEV
jgi:hypothetical protein